MSNNIVQFNEEIIKWKIKELVRRSVEETLNGLLEAEAEKLTQNGQNPEPESESHQDFRYLRPPDVLPEIRAGGLRGRGQAHA